MSDTFIRSSRYCAAHVGKSLLWVAADLVTIHCLVTLAAFDPQTAGGMFIAGMTANAVADVAIGRCIDRHPDHVARIAAVGLFAAAIAFPFTMIATPYGPGALLAATLIFRIAYAAYDVPHNALLSKLASTHGIAMQMSRFRTFGTGMASLLVGGGLYLVSDPGSLIVLLLSISVAAVTLGGCVLPLLRDDRFRIDREDDAKDGAFPMAFLLAGIIGIVGMGVLAKAQFHLPIEETPHDAGEIIVLLTVGRTLAGLLPLRSIGAGSGMAMMAGAYGLAGIAILPMVAGPGGSVGPFILGLVMGATNMVMWAMLPFVLRNAGAYGLYTMSIKIALGVAGLLMTAWLGSATRLTVDDFRNLATISVMACGVAALLLVWPSATSRPRRVATSGIDAR